MFIIEYVDTSTQYRGMHLYPFHTYMCDGAYIYGTFGKNWASYLGHVDIKHYSTFDIAKTELLNYFNTLYSTISSTTYEFYVTEISLGVILNKVLIISNGQIQNSQNTTYSIASNSSTKSIVVDVDKSNGGVYDTPEETLKAHRSGKPVDWVKLAKRYGDFQT